jgi:hypothetical protein
MLLFLPAELLDLVLDQVHTKELYTLRLVSKLFIPLVTERAFWSVPICISLRERDCSSQAQRTPYIFSLIANSTATFSDWVKHVDIIVLSVKKSWSFNLGLLTLVKQYAHCLTKLKNIESVK